MSILRIFDYIWVEIAYGLEKIVLLPRTWSVRFFAQKTPFLVSSIVTLRIRVETDPGRQFLLSVAKRNLTVSERELGISQIPREESISFRARNLSVSS